jgi:hypothetical protein
MSPYEAAKAGFAAGVKSVPSDGRLRKEIGKLLQLLKDRNGDIQS